MQPLQKDMVIAVRYWAAQAGATGLHDLDGIDDFRDDLGEDYVAFVKGRPGDLGGLYHLSVEIVSTFALSHVVRLLLEGVAFDLIKEGTKAFVLRPFLAAYKKLKERNRNGYADIEDLKLIFQDSIVIVDSLGDGSVAASVGQILQTLAASYSNLLLKTGEPPYEIHIPVFEDPAGDRPSRFRVLLDVDETIPTISVADYYKLWGLWYDFSRQKRIYDVSRQLLVDEPFMSRHDYWAVMEERWRSARANDQTSG
jgi:hypothetical protein